MQMKLDFSSPKKSAEKARRSKLDLVNQSENSNNRTPKKLMTIGLSEDEKENLPIRKIRAKRCLFGKSDPGIVREMLQKELDTILKVRFHLVFHPDFTPFSPDGDLILSDP